MRAWELMAALLAIPASASAEVYSQPECLQKTTSSSKSVTDWITVTGDVARFPVYARAHVTGMVDEKLPAVTIGIFVDEVSVAQRSGQSAFNPYIANAEVDTELTLLPNREYKFTARADAPDGVRGLTVSLGMNIGDGCRSR